MGMDFSVTASSSTNMFSKGASSISSTSQQNAREIKANFENYGKKVGSMSSVLSTVKTSPEQMGQKAQQLANDGQAAATRLVDSLINVIPITANYKT